MIRRVHSKARFFVIGFTLAALAACGEKQLTSPAGSSAGSASTPATAVQQPIGPPSLGPIAFVSNRDGANAIFLANSDGSGVTRLTSGEEPAWAPGGGQLAFRRGDAIYIINADCSGETAVTTGGNPAWSPDGRRLVFNTAADGNIDIVNVDGSGRHRLVDPGLWYRDGPMYGAYWPSWSPDGRTVAFIRTSYDDPWSLFVVDVAGGTDPRPLVNGWASENTAWSPDGSRIAFGAGPSVIGVAYADGSAWAVQTSGFDAAWTPTGDLIVNRFTGPPTAQNAAGSRMRIFLSGGSTPLIPETIAPARLDYWDYQAAWAF